VGTSTDSTRATRAQTANDVQLTHPAILHLHQQVRQQLAKVLHHEKATAIRDAAQRQQTALAR
jgi:hypothetical protein